MISGGCYCGAVRYESRGKLLRFVKAKAPWHDIGDALPQFEEGMPKK